MYKFQTGNQKLDGFINNAIDLCKPDNIKVCDGSDLEYNDLIEKLVKQGTLHKIHSRENCYLARSDPSDVARIESRTFICSKNKSDAGPTNNWVDPVEMKTTLTKLFDRCMVGRTMYIIPFSMGPINGPYSIKGVQITDSAYVAVSMRTMTRILPDLENVKDFVPCLHSVGAPLTENKLDVSWPCNEVKYIAHFPETKEIMSYGSGYGGNALLGKKCLALRIASVIGKENGWLAEHMLIISVTNPAGVKKYMAAAFPSACGKTNLAMLKSTLPGWEIKCIGDDIAWIHVGTDGKMYAINPEYGLFGVAPGTSNRTNPNVMTMLDRNTIFTNVAVKTDYSDVWWEGLTATDNLINWQGCSMQPACDLATRKGVKHTGETVAAHPNSRFTVPISQCPVLDEGWANPMGVPLDAIIFGGRRSTIVPLVYQSKSWEHGVLCGAMISSETTAAAEGPTGRLRHDPFAMLPFFGYNIGDYFSHWLNFSNKNVTLPKIFYVNWFRKENNSYLWPGYSENCRVLKWIHDRITDPLNNNFKETAIGLVPRELDMTNLTVPDDNMKKLFEINKEEWLTEFDGMKEYFTSLGIVPKELFDQLNVMCTNLDS